MFGLAAAPEMAAAVPRDTPRSRSLVLIFGASLQAFAIVLMAFILGIGLGSAWIASPNPAGKAGEKTVILLLCIAAAWVTLLAWEPAATRTMARNLPVTGADSA